MTKKKKKYSIDAKGVFQEEFSRGTRASFLHLVARISRLVLLRTNLFLFFIIIIIININIITIIIIITIISSFYTIQHRVFIFSRDTRVLIVILYSPWHRDIKYETPRQILRYNP